MRSIIQLILLALVVHAEHANVQGPVESRTHSEDSRDAAAEKLIDMLLTKLSRKLLSLASTMIVARLLMSHGKQLTTLVVTLAIAARSLMTNCKQLAMLMILPRNVKADLR